MRKTKLCCFTVNTTHACIIANNFIDKNLKNVKIIYINEKEESKKLGQIISKFYKSFQDKMYYSEWLNENILNNYAEENFVFVVHGKEKFVESTNKFLNLNEFEGYIINCYDVCDMVSSVPQIVSKHDYYINTAGIVTR